MLTHAMTTSEMTSLKSYIVETNTELNTMIVQQRVLKRKWRNFVFVRVSFKHDPYLSVF